jgi:hypothetical protein
LLIFDFIILLILELGSFQSKFLMSYNNEYKGYQETGPLLNYGPNKGQHSIQYHADDSSGCLSCICASGLTFCICICVAAICCVGIAALVVGGGVAALVYVAPGELKQEFVGASGASVSFTTVPLGLVFKVTVKFSMSIQANVPQILGAYHIDALYGTTRIANLAQVLSTELTATPKIVEFAITFKTSDINIKDVLLQMIQELTSRGTLTVNFRGSFAIGPFGAIFAKTYPINEQIQFKLLGQ